MCMSNQVITITEDCIYTYLLNYVVKVCFKKCGRFLVSAGNNINFAV